MSRDTALGGMAEKVCAFSSSLASVTEIFVVVSQRCCGEVATSRHCSPSGTPSHFYCTEQIDDFLFFFTLRHYVIDECIDLMMFKRSLLAHFVT